MSGRIWGRHENPHSEELVFWLVFESEMSAHSTTAFDITCHVTAIGTWSNERPFLTGRELEVRSEVHIACSVPDNVQLIEAALCAVTCCSSSSQGCGYYMRRRVSIPSL
jgi:hypothetical protein